MTHAANRHFSSNLSGGVGLNALIKHIILVVTALAFTSRLPASFGAQYAVFLLQSSDTAAVW
jgi:hypothetical protein